MFEKEIMMDKSLQTKVFPLKTQKFFGISSVLEENEPFVVYLYETISFQTAPKYHSSNPFKFSPSKPSTSVDKNTRSKSHVPTSVDIACGGFPTRRRHPS